jgi:hypothetical protein
VPPVLGERRIVAVLAHRRTATLGRVALCWENVARGGRSGCAIATVLAHRRE